MTEISTTDDRPGSLMRLVRAAGGGLLNIVLALIFWLLITPVGFIFRMFRGDPMRRELTNESSYRVPSGDEAERRMDRMY